MELCLSMCFMNTLMIILMEVNKLSLLIISLEILQIINMLSSMYFLFSMNMLFLLMIFWFMIISLLSSMKVSFMLASSSAYSTEIVKLTCIKEE